jgi:hypothetical protein
MTTAIRITISIHSVQATLAEWKAQREAAEREAGPERTAVSRERCYQRAPADYAEELAPYIFSLLQKHQEAP